MSIETNWVAAIEAVEKHVVMIRTPSGWGTGWFFANASFADVQDSVCLATANHVVEHEKLWEEPIRLEHTGLKKGAMIRPSERAILNYPRHDVAAIVFPRALLPTLPSDPISLPAPGRRPKVGNEVGWLGFPSVAGGALCFFSGRISAWNKEEQQYFVDGVAINGVSGGPAFLGERTEDLKIIGVVSSYLPNVRPSGQALPGLCTIRSVEFFHTVIKTFDSLEEAKATAAEQPQPTKDVEKRPETPRVSPESPGVTPDASQEDPNE